MNRLGRSIGFAWLTVAAVFGLMGLYGLLVPDTGKETPQREAVAAVGYAGIALYYFFIAIAFRDHFRFKQSKTAILSTLFVSIWAIAVATIMLAPFPLGPEHLLYILAPALLVEGAALFAIRARHSTSVGGTNSEVISASGSGMTMSPEGDFPTLYIAQTGMEAETMPPLQSMRSDVTAQAFIASVLRQIETSVQSSQAPPKVKAVRLYSVGCKTLLSSEIGPQSPSEFYALGSVSRIIGASGSWRA